MKFVIIPWDKKLYGKSIDEFPVYTFREIEKRLSDEIFGLGIEIWSDEIEYSAADWFFFWEHTSDTENVYKKLWKAGFLNHTIFYMSEPDVVIPWHNRKGLEIIKKYFHYVVTWNRDLVDHDRVYDFKSFYKWKHMLADRCKEDVPFGEKKLMTCIIGCKRSKVEGELYSERKKVIDFFEENYSAEFEFYGAGWPEGVYKTYKGRADRKADIYRNYKFALCIENIKAQNMITEKPMDCFTCGIIPVYYGAPEFSEYVPEKCFINYERFSTVKEMHDYLAGMGEEEYGERIDAINEFLNSCDMAYFSPEENARGILQILCRKDDEYFDVSRTRILGGWLLKVKENTMKRIRGILSR